MTTTIRRVAYAYNSELERIGQPGFFLDVFSVVDGKTQVDLHSAYMTKAALFEAMEGVIPLLDEPQSVDNGETPGVGEAECQSPTPNSL